ncbi:hypothetical protein K8I28_09995 [bacterium]|nr:hypothetical protein [bacterium]
MICAHMLVPQEGIDEFVPMALREVRCQLRSSNPEKYTRILRNMGEAADPENCECPRNHLGDWEECPLHRARGMETYWQTEEPIMPQII